MFISAHHGAHCSPSCERPRIIATELISSDWLIRPATSGRCSVGERGIIISRAAASMLWSLSSGKSSALSYICLRGLFNSGRVLGANQFVVRASGGSKCPNLVAFIYVSHKIVLSPCQLPLKELTIGCYERHLINCAATGYCVVIGETRRTGL